MNPPEKVDRTLHASLDSDARQKHSCRAAILKGAVVLSKLLLCIIESPGNKPEVWADKKRSTVESKVPKMHTFLQRTFL